MALTWSHIQNSVSKTNVRLRVVVALVAWMIVSLAMLSVLGLLTFEHYFIISYVGLLSIMHVYAPTDRQSRWWAVLRWVSIIGFVIFATLIYQRVIAVL